MQAVLKDTSNAPQRTQAKGINKAGVQLETKTDAADNKVLFCHVNKTQKIVSKIVSCGLHAYTSDPSSDTLAACCSPARGCCFHSYTPVSPSCCQLQLS